MEVNCRDKNICIFCKKWLGEEASPHFITGRTSVDADKVGVCSYDGEQHRQTDLCRKFEKRMIYL